MYLDCAHDPQSNRVNAGRPDTGGNAADPSSPLPLVYDSAAHDGEIDFHRLEARVFTLEKML